MNINDRRLLEDLHTLREFTDTPGEGVTRFSYGVQDRKAREYIIKEAMDAGCTVRTDDIGNIRIGLGANIPGQPVILCGSHIDTVRNGGWLDGIYGVCSALEVLRTLAAAGSAAAPPDSSSAAALPDTAATEQAAGCGYEMIIFAEEEGSNFGSTMTGSKFITGIYGEAQLDELTNDDGQTLRQVLAGFAAADPDAAAPGSALQVPWDLSDAAAMLELHIEQGPVLERADLPIGIVDSIFGMRVIEVSLQGVGNHAGATPMKERYDALSTAAECILAAEKIVSSDPEERTVVTIGKLEVQPNCSNVIPETVRFSLEVRDKDAEEIDGNMDRIIHQIRQIAGGRGVKCEIREHSKSAPLHLSDEIIAVIRQAAEDAGIPHKVMDSGAVHDACMIAQAGVPTGMIFVPSIGGRSHVPEENTEEADLVRGARLLLEVVCRLMGGAQA
ncbi:MAG: M20 family metallo-hydrolase [Firmicutes bacterium]|nr:M20 family metallo-hydrolase [Bacillota bacterium]